MIFLTTTAVEIDEELLNRCLILTVDESREQTERIHALQRKARTLEGLVAREEKKDLLRVLRNAQRLLQPLAVVNPYADELTFTAERTRTRRDHEKYLTLIDAIALLHQHQRTVEYVEESRFRLPRRSPEGTKIGFVRATLDDIALANRLAPELLGRSLDELPHHFQMHFIHAAEILGYKHPDADTRVWWLTTYTRLVHDLHLWPETEEQLDLRLGDNREQWLARNDKATVA